MTIEYREYRPEDSREVCYLLNEVFSKAPCSYEIWEEITAADFTAPVAVKDGRIVGAIPMARRVYRVAPGCEVVTWVLYRVGVHADLRGHGVGSGMQEAIKEFLPGRGDTLLVNSCGRHTPQENFYRRNGLYDVAAPQWFLVDPPGTRDTPASALTPIDFDDFLDRRSRWLDLFESCYVGTGGYPARSTAYPFEWMAARRRVGFPSVQSVFGVAGSAERPRGYVIYHETAERTRVEEMAVQDSNGETIQEILDGLRALGRPVEVNASHGTVTWDILNTASSEGWAQATGVRSIVVHILDIENTARKVLCDVPALRDVEITVKTEKREGRLHGASAAGRTIALNMRELTLSRLLMRRINVAQAVREERIAVTGSTPEDIDALTEMFAPCPWVFHGTDGL